MCEQFFTSQAVEVVTVITAKQPTVAGLLQGVYTPPCRQFTFGSINKEQILANIRQFYPTDGRIVILSLLFPNADQKTLQQVAKTTDQALTYIVNGINEIADHLSNIAVGRFEGVQTYEQLDGALLFAKDIFARNGIMRLPIIVYNTYRERLLLVSSRIFSKLVQQIPSNCGDIPEPLLSPNASYDIGALMAFGVEVIVGFRNGNVENSITLLLEIGKFRHRMSMEPVPNDAVDISPQQLVGIIAEYGEGHTAEKVAFLGALASKNYMIAWNMLVASHSMKMVVPCDIWDALAAEQNFNGWKYVNLDAIQLICNSPTVAPDAKSRDRRIAAEFFANLSESSDLITAFRKSPLVDLTIFKDLFRDKIEIWFGDKRILSTDVKMLCRSAGIDYPAAEFIVSMLKQNFKRNAIAQILRAICFYPWTQGESARLILALDDFGVKKGVRGEELEKFSQALLDLYDAGRQNGKTVIKISEDDSIEIESMSIQGGIPQNSSAPANWGFQYVAPWAYFYTKLRQTPDGQSTVLAAQMAAHI